jgi:hypothetical protein
MQVNCTKCFQPIALTDIVESNNGRLSHLDCKRPNVLTPEERSLVFVYCSGHAVAWCLACDVDYRYTELAADILGGARTNMCPRCRQDLTEAVRAHVFRCVMLPVEIKNKVQALREAAQRLVKESQQLRDRSDVLIAEAEVALFERQRALREAMSRRVAS